MMKSMTVMGLNWHQEKPLGGRDDVKLAGREFELEIQCVYEGVFGKGMMSSML